MSVKGRRNQLATRRCRPYRSRLREAWLQLTLYAQLTGHALPRLCNAAKDGVLLLISLIQDQYERRKLIHLSKHAVLSLQYVHRDLKGKLRSTWDAIESWGFELETSLRPPLSRDALVAMQTVCRLWALDVAQEGKNLLAFGWWIFSIMISMEFYGLLRVGELCSLQVNHITFPSPLDAPFAMLAILRSKIRRAMGRIQFCVVRDALTTEWLRWWMQGLPPNSLL